MVLSMNLPLEAWPGEDRVAVLCLRQGRFAARLLSAGPLALRKRNCAAVCNPALILDQRYAPGQTEGCLDLCSESGTWQSTTTPLGHTTSSWGPRSALPPRRSLRVECPGPQVRTSTSLPHDHAASSYLAHVAAASLCVLCMEFYSGPPSLNAKITWSLRHYPAVSCK